jgi:hypothetical protein
MVLAFGIFAAPTVSAQEGPIQLPAGYIDDLIHEASPAGPIVASHDGVIYMQHRDSLGGVAISRLDVDDGTLDKVLEIPPWVFLSWVVGGPGESFFAILDGVVQQVQADGTMSAWSSGPVAVALFAFTKDGRMIGTNPLATSVIELHPDGSTTTLLDGRTMIYDLVVADDGTIYFSDFLVQELVELAPDGSHRVLASIAPDNTELALDGAGNLYLNSAASGFARVDRTTGALTPQIAPNAPCPVIPSPAVTVFDADDRAVFFSWVANLITWADLATGNGGFAIEPTWANSIAADIGPDGALYVGVNGCGASFPTRMMQVTRDGVSSVRASGSIGLVNGLALDSNGGLYVAAASEISAGLYYAPPGDATLSLVPGSSGFELHSVAVGAEGQVFGYLNPDGNGAKIGELLGATLTEHTVSLPAPPQELVLEVAPDGDVYAYLSDADTFFTGPTGRWLVRLDFDTGSYEEVSRHDRAGCCPLGNLGIDPEGVLLWVVNPDFLIYEVVPGISDEIFASGIPVDAGYANRNADGDLFINSPEVVHLIWQATLAERIELVSEEVELLVAYEALSPGLARPLKVILSLAASAADRGQTDATRRLMNASLRVISKYVRKGMLEEAQADLFVEAAQRLVLPYL